MFERKDGGGGGADRNDFDGVRLLYRSINVVRRSIRAFSIIVSIRSAPKIEGIFQIEKKKKNYVPS